MRRILLAGLIAALAAPAMAQNVTLATTANPTLDPHFNFFTNNIAVWRHFTTTLTMQDPDKGMMPNLAVSWSAPDERTWEFQLNPAAKFRDGTPVTADDVVFSLARVPSIPGNPSPYTPLLQGIGSFEATGPHTLRIHTSTAAPDVPFNLGGIGVLSRRAVEGKTSSDINNRSALLESGPYTVENFVQGDRIVLKRNPGWFGGAVPWEQVTIRFITNDASRVAALLAGDVDFIDFVPPSDAPRLRDNPKLAVWDGPSNRLMMLYPNMQPGPVAEIADADGKPLAVNPLRDLRVRQALSKAIDRAALVERIMDGAGVATAQYGIPGMIGYDPTIATDKADPQGARALLAAAGYPSGFTLTVNCSNNRYPNDDKVCQALGQMLTRAGFRAKVETMPVATLLPMMKGTQEAGSKSALGMLGLSSSSSFPITLPISIQTADPATGRGAYNFSRYSNSAVDADINAAYAALDPVQREARTRAAQTAAMAELPVLPLFFLKVLTAGRADLTYRTNIYEETSALNLRPAPR